METVRWLGIDWDEGPDKGGPHAPYTQSERLDIYQEHADRLLASDWAYRCYCSSERLSEVRKAQQARKEPPRYDRHCRELSPDDRASRDDDGAPSVVRFKTPLSGETLTHDALRGEVSFANDTLDDFVVLKSDGYPTYHLAAIVDDHLMEITHVLRGEEWISSLPRHVLIYQAFGWEPPVFAHVSRILGSDRAKLSKRHGAHAALAYRDLGYLPEAIINFLALLGWSLDDKTEIIHLDTLIAAFDTDRLLTNPAVFNAEKLEWMNGVYIRMLTKEDLAARIRPFLEAEIGVEIPLDQLVGIAEIVQDRIKTLDEVREMASFVSQQLYQRQFDEASYESSELLERLWEEFDSVRDWSINALEAKARKLAEDSGMKAGQLFSIVRLAVTGQTVTPPLFESIAILGREGTLSRLRTAIADLRTPVDFVSHAESETSVSTGAKGPVAWVEAGAGPGPDQEAEEGDAAMRDQSSEDT